MPLVFVNLLQYTGLKGGMETYARELYREIGRLESPFEFVGYGSREFMNLDHSWFPGEVISSGISGENRFTWAGGELFAVSRAAEKHKADLIHGPSMFGPLKSRMPVVVTIHDLLYFSNPEFMANPLYTRPVKWMERRGASNATRIITISKFSADAIRKYLEVAENRIDLIPLAGTPQKVLSPGGPREPAMFLAVGQRRPHKNFGNLVRAVATIPEQQRPRLVITGSYGEDPLIPLVKELGVQAWIDLRSWVDRDQLDQLYSTATALLDASLVTGFSLPTLEAMMGGMPVVLADTPIFREVGGNAADYFDPVDPKSIAGAMTRLMEDPSHRDQMSEAGVRWAAQFSWNLVAERTLKSFERALQDAQH